MDLPKLRRSRIINLLCLLLLGGTALFLALRWNAIPEKIPGHYNFAGEIDRWGSRSELVILPILAAIFYGGMTLLESFPAAWNTGVTVTEENRDRVYPILLRMVERLKLVICLIFSFLTVNSALARPLPIWFLPVFLILLFGVLTVSLRKLYRAK